MVLTAKRLGLVFLVIFVLFSQMNAAPRKRKHHASPAMNFFDGNGIEIRQSISRMDDDDLDDENTGVKAGVSILKDNEGGEKSKEEQFNLPIVKKKKKKKKKKQEKMQTIDLAKGLKMVEEGVIFGRFRCDHNGCHPVFDSGSL